MSTRAFRIVVVVAFSIAITLVAPFLGGPLSGDQGEFIFWRLRVPRVLVGAMMGATLSIVGAVFQVLFSNPLAEASTVGTAAGATMGTLVALVLGVSGGALPVVVVFAFAGAFLVSLLIAAIASIRHNSQSDVLLAGIAISLAATAISMGLQYSADMQALFTATQWSLGHIAQVNYRGVLLLLPLVAASCGVCLALSRSLYSFSVGEDLARSYGVNVARLRAVALGFGSLGVAACVAWCGPIAFVGLVVPHLIRLLVGASVRVVLPLSCVGGAGYLVLCDLVGRTLLPTRELPVGMITSAVGAPALVLLLLRRRAPEA